MAKRPTNKPTRPSVIAAVGKAATDLYAMIVSGNFLAPDVRHGDVVIVSPSEPVEVGKFAVLRTKAGLITLTRIISYPSTGLHPTDFGRPAMVGLLVADDGKPVEQYLPVNAVEYVHRVTAVQRDLTGDVKPGDDIEVKPTKRTAKKAPAKAKRRGRA